MKQNNRYSRLARWALGAYLLVAVLILVSPVSPSRIIDGLTRWLHEDLGLTVLRQGMVEFAANIILFVPLGFFITLLFQRWWIGVLVSIVLSTSVELLQVFLPGRLATPRDVLSNTIGGVIGCVIALVFLGVARKRALQVDVDKRPLGE